MGGRFALITQTVPRCKPGFELALILVSAESPVLHIACSIINTIINILHMPNGVDIHSVFRYRHHYMDDSPRRLPIMAKYEYLQKKAGRKKPAVYAEGLAYPALP